MDAFIIFVQIFCLNLAKIRMEIWPQASNTVKQTSCISFFYLTDQISAQKQICMVHVFSRGFFLLHLNASFSPVYRAEL